VATGPLTGGSHESPAPHLACGLSLEDQPYTVLAVVSTRSSTVFDSFDDLRAALVARAALLGGDAVILRSRSTKTTPIFNTVGFVVSEQRIMVGDVIALPSR
jgi:hypothetical protein